MLILACRTKHGITYMECFQGRSSSVVPRRLLSVFPPLFLPLFLLTRHPPIPLCLCLLLRAAKSVMVTALLSFPSVCVGADPGHLTPMLWRLESWGATLSSTPGHLTSPLGPDGVTTLFPARFPDEHTAPLPSTRATLSCPALNDFLLLPDPQPTNLHCVILH